jgi:hypothetical protein
MVKDIKDLEKLLKMCRKQGVQSIRWGDVEFHLGDIPSPVVPTAKRLPTPAPFIPGGVDADTKILTDELTEEQMLYWSTGIDPAAQGQ